MELIDRLSDLAAGWWTQVPNDRAAYNYRTDVSIVEVKCETLLDGGAGVNSWAEEIVVGAINVAMAKGIPPNDPRFPVVQLEKWPVPECCTGISRGHDVPIIGAAVMRVKLLELGKDKGPEILVRGKIFAKGTSDWLGLILGARALDCVERGGLGFRPSSGAHHFDRLGIAVPRTEKIGYGDQYKDLAFRMDVWCP